MSSTYTTLPLKPHLTYNANSQLTFQTLRSVLDQTQVKNRTTLISYNPLEPAEDLKRGMKVIGVSVSSTNIIKERARRNHAQSNLYLGR